MTSGIPLPGGIMSICGCLEMLCARDVFYSLLTSRVTLGASVPTNPMHRGAALRKLLWGAQTLTFINKLLSDAPINLAIVCQINLTLLSLSLVVH